MMGDQQQKLALPPWSCTCIWLGLGDKEGESAGDERASSPSVVTYQQGELTEQ